MASVSTSMSTVGTYAQMQGLNEPRARAVGALFAPPGERSMCKEAGYLSAEVLDLRMGDDKGACAWHGVNQQGGWVEIASKVQITFSRVGEQTRLTFNEGAVRLGVKATLFTVPFNFKATLLSITTDSSMENGLKFAVRFDEKEEASESKVDALSEEVEEVSVASGARSIPDLRQFATAAGKATAQSAPAATSSRWSGSWGLGGVIKAAGAAISASASMAASGASVLVQAGAKAASAVLPESVGKAVEGGVAAATNIYRAANFYATGEIVVSAKEVETSIENSEGLVEWMPREATATVPV